MNDAFTNSLKNSPKFSAEIEQERTKYWVDIFNSGVALVKQEKTADAIDKFTLATQILPGKIEAYKNLAFAYSVNQNDSMAIQTYQTALKMHPEDFETKNFLGQVYYRVKKYDQAVKILTEVVAAADPKTKTYSDALYTLAYSYDLMEQSDKAIETYQNALKISPNDKDLTFNLGRLYFMQGKYDLAIENFAKVLVDNPDDFDANLNIGNAYLQLEKFKEAIPYFEKATVVKPNNTNAWNNLGVSYVRSGDLEKGKAAFAKADELKKQE
jgi:tetratricopeptide (TPR) repeat protein